MTPTIDDHAPPGSAQDGREPAPVSSPVRSANAAVDPLQATATAIPAADRQTDAIDHPPHYQTEAGIEAIDVMEQYGLGLHLGSAMKYLLRAGRKGEAITDLRKAEWYVKRWLDGVGDPGIEWTSPNLLARDWCSPDGVADAFALTGWRRVSVVAILRAASGHVGNGAELAGVKDALDAIRRAIGELQVAA